MELKGNDEMTEKEKMLAGELYDPSDEELSRLRTRARKLARKYNLTDEDETDRRRGILMELLPETPVIPALQAPVHFDYGCNTYFGKACDVNFNFTCLDVCPVHIGDNAFIGPNVTIATPMHPLLPEERNVRTREDGSTYNLEYAKRRRNSWGRVCDRCGKRCDKRYSAAQPGSGKPLQSDQGDHRSGQNNELKQCALCVLFSVL